MGDARSAATPPPAGSPAEGTAVTVLLFASAREAAGRNRDQFSPATVGEILDEATARYGDRFGRILEKCRVWVNGEPVDRETAVGAGDELAVLPPVSGGAS